ncbi:MAG: hypothetical protein GF353_11570 [Candidatus Lokiarchaeota archaeon]|nr:hypothetical protein [Candidatus Lokiarchaeota archaeon]
MAITLNALQFLQGSLALTFVLISMFVGIKLLLKYAKFKQKTLLYAGITWIFIVSPWFNTAINFIYVLVSGNSVSVQLYLLLGYIWVPLPLISWIILFTDLKYKEKQVPIVLITIIQGIIYEIVFIYFIIIDYTVVGTMQGVFNDELTVFFIVYILAIMIIVLISGSIFALETIKSDKPDIRLKSKFLLLAWIFFFVGAILDAGLFQFTAILLIIVRILLITSAIEFYFGFFLPETIKKWLINEN